MFKSFFYGLRYWYKGYDTESLSQMNVKVIDYAIDLIGTESQTGYTCIALDYGLISEYGRLISAAARFQRDTYERFVLDTYGKHPAWWNKVAPHTSARLRTLVEFKFAVQYAKIKVSLARCAC